MNFPNKARHRRPGSPMRTAATLVPVVLLALGVSISAWGANDKSSPERATYVGKSADKSANVVSAAPTVVNAVVEGTAIERDTSSTTSSSSTSTTVKPGFKRPTPRSTATTTTQPAASTPDSSTTTTTSLSVTTTTVPVTTSTEPDGTINAG